MMLFGLFGCFAVADIQYRAICIDDPCCTGLPAQWCSGKRFVKLVNAKNNGQMRKMQVKKSTIQKNRKGRPASLHFPHVLIDMLCLPGALSQFQSLNNKLSNH